MEAKGTPQEANSIGVHRLSFLLDALDMPLRHGSTQGVRTPCVKIN